MEITGRLVADAAVRNTNNGREVTGFRLAINHRYVSGGEKVEETTYVDCAYWRTTAIAPYLTKGMIVQLQGRMSASAWVSKDGELRAGLNFHTNEINLLTGSAKKETEQEKPAQTARTNSTNRRAVGIKPNAGLQPSKQFN